MIEHIKRVVSEFMSNFTSTKYGQISAYNPNDYTVKVLIMPTLQETGFVPLAAPWVGNNFGAVFGPAVGDAVRLDFVDGNVEATIVGSRFFNNGARPPVVQSGQAAIVDSKGSYIKLNNDGTININAATGMYFSAQTIALQATQTIGLTAGTEVTNSAPQIELDGQVTQGTGPQGGFATLNGPVTVNNDLTAQGKSVHNHTHLEHGAGSQTSPPT
ncbi:phage baseplate assembly protein V [Paraburkholderia sp. D15]|uniref:phage baseplate assembly protein V n=1 Tax=Paraburkholderia sp. D15 TaxID=2880218 RepID=UPI00247A665F|nr:phage baseplate assembly protein V [Paraburkholderia sp. D15]WGS53588.1 phage baseplate assembly protein V [Paraburkholderia sp. D15]